MKKLYKFLLALFILVRPLPLLVHATSNPVKTLKVEFKDNQLTYYGEVNDGVYAVAILVYDPEGKQILLDTSEVDKDNKFNDSINLTLTKNGTHTVKASNYEGGEFIEDTFTFIKEEDKKDPPKVSPEEETKKEETKEDDKKTEPKKETIIPKEATSEDDEIEEDEDMIDEKDDYKDIDLKEDDEQPVVGVMEEQKDVNIPLIIASAAVVTLVLAGLYIRAKRK